MTTFFGRLRRHRSILREVREKGWTVGSAAHYVAGVILGSSITITNLEEEGRDEESYR
jgi:hypothetical protein